MKIYSTPKPDKPKQPNDEIWYTSTDGNIVVPTDEGGFGANIISNTYEGEKGIIKFNGDVTSIGDRAFDSCDRLTSIEIPNSVTSIGSEAFFYCEGLTSIDIPSGVTWIGSHAFHACFDMDSMTVEPIIPPTVNGGSAIHIGLSVIYVPSESVDAYKSAENWSDYAKKIQPIPTV